MHDPTRREWVKRFLLGTACSVSGAPWRALLVAAEAPVQSGAGLLHLALEDHPPLASVGGAVLLELGILEPPLLLIRESADQIRALDATCTHAGCTVGLYNSAAGHVQCPCHGSRFDSQGRVLRGPAEEPLAAFEATLEAGGSVTVRLPTLPGDVRPIRLSTQVTPSRRLKLDFMAEAGARYEVQHRAAAAAAFVVMPFAVVPGGAATHTSFTATSAGVRTVYVDATGTRGFYVIARLDP